MSNYKVVSFFSGCGGLDLGFEQAGFDVIWANEFDETIQNTYRYNHPRTELNVSDIRKLSAADVPDCDGFIGGPPCQSWSRGGKMLGLNDSRGQVFLDYIRLIREKKPKFFVIENVEGIVSDKHFPTFMEFLNTLSKAGYKVQYKTVNVSNFGIAQNRFRVFVVGIRNDIKNMYVFPSYDKNQKRLTLRDAIGDIKHPPVSFVGNNGLPNHEYYEAPFDKYYLERNRYKGWNESSLTIVASANLIPLHPNSANMVFDECGWHVVDAEDFKSRRLSVRECARIQSFPDDFVFVYQDVRDGYKMVGNAVPPKFAKILADSIRKFMSVNDKNMEQKCGARSLIGYYKDNGHLDAIIKNNLYYVRTGFRTGAMNYPIKTLSPDYLLLHHDSERFLFKLKRIEPVMRTAEELKNMGFNPRGNVYLCFEIDMDEALELNLKKDFPMGKKFGVSPSMIVV